MLDLGETLIHGRTPLPYVVESLEAVARFRTRDGKPLEHCLVSDFHLATPFSEIRVLEIFQDYLAILEQVGLRAAFEPVARRVTLSTHANVMKPDRRIFDLALKRLGVKDPLEACLFVTENEAHIAAARDLGIAGLQFGRGGPGGFTDWARGLVQIALMVDPRPGPNLNLALEVLCRAQGLEAVEPARLTPGRLTAAAKVWRALDDPSLGDLSGVHVSLPATLWVTLTADDPEVDVTLPEDALEEATAFVRSLKAHGKVSGAAPSLLGDPTHVVETDASGRRLLKRIGFD